MPLNLSLNSSKKAPAAHEKLQQLAKDIKHWANTLGFNQVGISDINLDQYQQGYQSAVTNGYFGDMDFMSRNQELRQNPALLQEGAIRVISVRLNYLPQHTQIIKALASPQQAYVSRYALGRDYHKLMRKKLKQLGDQIAAATLDFSTTEFRPFVDSAPVLERPLAEKAGLGWVGKHTLLINPDEGSLFFLGEILLNLPLPIDKPIKNQCGKCSACLQICPSKAIVAPYKVDARRCISYLTIESDAPIPVELRPLIGNRIYGCDDCQLVCPWNRHAQYTQLADFAPRHRLDNSQLLALFAWSETEFLDKTQGSAIRRIGYQRWQRNLAVALGNADHSLQIIEALKQAQPVNAMVAEHIEWALKQHELFTEDKDKKGSRLTQRLIRIIEKNPMLK